jgi:hypothetical protein
MRGRTFEPLNPEPKDEERLCLMRKNRLEKN